MYLPALSGDKYIDLKSSHPCYNNIHLVVVLEKLINISSIANSFSLDIKNDYEQSHMCTFN